MNNDFNQRYFDMNHEERRRTEENLNAMINSMEKVRLFIEREEADSLMASAREKLRFIHEVRQHCRSMVLEILEKLGTAEIVNAWNAYAIAAGEYDDEVYDMEQFDEHMKDRSPLDVVTDCIHGEFSPCDSYWYYDGNVNPSSFDYWDDDNSPIRLDYVAAYMVEHGEAFGISEVAEILEGRYIDGE